MQMHWWTYVRHREWVCDYCGGKTNDPNKGKAAQPTCPGPPSKKRK